LAPPTTTPLTVSPRTSTVQPVVQQPQPTPNLWQFYVDDINSTIPNASVTADTLKEIARTIPSSVPFLAEAEVGLIPYQYTWTVINREGPVALNAPEGGYAYIAWGYGKVKTNQFLFDFPAIEDNAYVILAIGKSDDGTSTDLNTPLQLSDFHAGFAGTNFATPAKGQVFSNRKVVNKAWLSQQLWWASSHTLITVSILDLFTGNRYDYNVDPHTFVWSAK